MFDMKALKAAKEAAKQRFLHIEGIVGFGIGDQTIRINVLSPTVKAQVEAEASEIDGIPLTVEVTGDIVAR